MTELISYVASPGSVATLPVIIDYVAALALRKMLLATLLNTGARINEALAQIQGYFSLAPP